LKDILNIIQIMYLIIKKIKKKRTFIFVQAKVQSSRLRFY